MSLKISLEMKSGRGMHSLQITGVLAPLLGVCWMHNSVRDFDQIFVCSDLVIWTRNARHIAYREHWNDISMYLDELVASKGNLVLDIYIYI